MPIDPARTQYYRRARFTTRLPTHYLYARSHFWLLEVEPGLWRVGLTHFATRMLGDFVECEFQVAEGERVKIGQTIGWVEGFKAVADIFCVAEGDFAGFNTELNKKPELVDKDAYDRGWLFTIRGVPDATCVDCSGYVGLLDQAVDRILSQSGEGHGESHVGESPENPSQNGDDNHSIEDDGGPWEKKGKC
ncbi:MAG: glycine cleavage system protein H [Planctomycetes bacterium]|nr:glycine cleavage system protein H [Planctomycetota bacterium]